MTTAFYRYLPTYDGNLDAALNTAYSPAFRLPMQSKLLASVASIKDELVPSFRYKIIAKGLPADWRYGRIDYKPEDLASIGWTPEAMQAMALKLAQGMGLEFLTAEAMAEDLRRFTDLKEREPGLFVVAEASKALDMERPEVIIDCR